MDSDRFTAFAKHFIDQTFDLIPGASPYEGASIFLSFFVEDGTLDIGVYNRNTQSYSHSFKSTDPAAVAPFIAEVEAAYGITVPEPFKTLPAEYLSQIGESFGIYTELMASLRECELCGTNEDRLEGFYYPPLASGEPASLGLYHGYGCYSGDSVYGDPAVVGAEALRILKHAIKYSDSEPAQKRARAFQKKLKAVLAA